MEQEIKPPFYYYLLRWSLLLTAGVIGQLLTYIAYPFVILYYIIKIKSKVKLLNYSVNPKRSLEQIIEDSKKDTLRDSYYLSDDDTHAALVHNHWYFPWFNLLAERGLAGLIRDSGSIKRRNPVDQPLPVSGDALSSWVFMYNLANVKRPDLVHRIATHYIKNALGLQHYENGKVSARSSNGGINYVFDGYRGINQPCFGPQYYTSAALFSLAYKEASLWLKPFWLVVYIANYLLMGGWIYWLCPIIHTQTNFIYYSHHITMLNLYSLSKTQKVWKYLGGYKYAMKWLTFLLGKENLNPLFYALYTDINKSHRDVTEWTLCKDILCTLPHGSMFVFQTLPGFDPEYYSNIAAQRPHNSALALCADLLIKNKPL